MPELRIEAEEARELEENVMMVLADRGITLRSETGNMVALAWCVVTIYGPIVLALLRKFIFAPKPQAAANQNQQTPNPQQSAPAGFSTFNPRGFPESEVQIMPGGGQVAGAIFRTPGDPSNIMPI